MFGISFASVLVKLDLPSAAVCCVNQMAVKESIVMVEQSAEQCVVPHGFKQR
jgi:hypothetical protein